ncbi:MAG: hypothetical protein WD579_03750 [Candidatus Paceibacterota bacterium]
MALLIYSLPISADFEGKKFLVRRQLTEQGWEQGEWVLRGEGDILSEIAASLFRGLEGFDPFHYYLSDSQEDLREWAVSEGLQLRITLPSPRGYVHVFFGKRDAGFWSEARFVREGALIGEEEFVDMSSEEVLRVLAGEFGKASVVLA